MIWKMKHPKATPEMLGHIPSFFSENDKRPAKEQANANYIYGGGWIPVAGFTMRPDGTLEASGDQPTLLLAEAKLRNETIRFYQHSWVAIIQPDGTYEISRMD